MHFYQLAVEVDYNTGNDCNHKNGVDGEKDGTYFPKEGDGNHISESCSRDHSVAIPECIAISGDVRLLRIERERNRRGFDLLWFS